MPDLAGLVDETIATLSGHTTDVPTMGSLVGDITATSTELAVDFGDQPGAGRPNGYIEIGSELLMVTRFNPQTGVATVPPWGRGAAGTKAAPHDAGDLVTVRPRYPRARVANAINQVLDGLSPSLFAVKTLDPVVTDEVDLRHDVHITLPADCLRVLRVDIQSPGPFAARHSHRTWWIDAANGERDLVVRECGPSTIFITYAATPSRLTDGDDFAVTGLPDSCADLVVLGALARLVLAPDAAHLQTSTVESAARAEVVQPSSGTTLARYFQALYTARLDSEQLRLQQTYPIQLLRRG